MSTTRALWLFLLAATGIRLALLGTLDLSGDEAHYWMWSQRLAPAYFSKGPGIALAIRASTALFGDNEFGVRFWSPLLGAGTSLLLYYFTRRLFSGKIAFWTVVALNATPIFNVGNLVMTIDPLSIFFWTAALYSFWIALERSPAFSWHWPFTGLLIGLGFLCKYTNALQLLSVVLVLALAPRLRRELWRANFWTLLAPFVLCTLPPLFWNAQHAWITFFHLRSRGGLAAAPGLHPLELLSFLGAHFGTYSPILFAGLAWAVVASARRAQRQLKLLYLFWFGLPVFTLYFLLSFNEAGAPNWDGLAFLSLAPLAMAFWWEKIESRLLVRRIALAGLALSFLLSAIVLDTDILRAFGWKGGKQDPLNRLRGWKSATSALETLRATWETKLGEPLFLIADERDRASEISFYLRDKRPAAPGHPPVYITESQDIRNQFSFWPRYDEFEARSSATRSPDDEVYTEEAGENRFLNRSALYLRENPGRPAHAIRSGFQSTESIALIEVRRGGELIRTLQVYLCRHYRTLPL